MVFCTQEKLQFIARDLVQAELACLAIRNLIAEQQGVMNWQLRPNDRIDVAALRKPVQDLEWATAQLKGMVR